MSTIVCSKLSYLSGRTNFVQGVSFRVGAGQSYGILGSTHAGESIITQVLLGFVRPQKGQVSIAGLDCWSQSRRIRQKTGYISPFADLPKSETVHSFLSLIERMRGTQSLDQKTALYKVFEINPNALIRTLSPEGRQCIQIMAAFLHRPSIVILDHPERHLSPSRRATLIDLIHDVRKKYGNVFIASRDYDFLEQSCTRIGFMQRGMLLTSLDTDDIAGNRSRIYDVYVSNRLANDILSEKGLDVLEVDYPRLRIRVRSEQIKVFFTALNTCAVQRVDVYYESPSTIRRHILP